MIMMALSPFDSRVTVIVPIFVLVSESIPVTLAIIPGTSWWTTIKVGVPMLKEILNPFNSEIWILPPPIEMPVTESFRVPFLEASLQSLDVRLFHS